MSRSRPCALASTTGRRSAKLRRSPLTLYCRAGNVTLRPPPPPPRLDSQIENPISFSPSSGPSLKWSSASASLPGGLPLSFGVILTVTATLLVLLGNARGDALQSRCPIGARLANAHDVAPQSVRGVTVP